MTGFNLIWFFIQIKISSCLKRLKKIGIFYSIINGRPFNKKKQIKYEKRGHFLMFFYSFSLTRSVNALLFHQQFGEYFYQFSSNFKSRLSESRVDFLKKYIFLVGRKVIFILFLLLEIERTYLSCCKHQQIKY